jgi:hypothetical protein
VKNGGKRRGLVRKEHLQILLFPDELAAIDDFRFIHRMPSRAAAVRELLRQGIGAVGRVVENAGVKSRDYSVLKASEEDRG